MVKTVDLSPAPPRQGISAAIAPFTSLRVGAFLLDWASDEHLAIRHQEHRSRLLWSSVPGRPFLTCAQVRSCKGRRGSRASLCGHP
jgi:hypothetical protein